MAFHTCTIGSDQIRSSPSTHSCLWLLPLIILNNILSHSSLCYLYFWCVRREWLFISLSVDYFTCHHNLFPTFLYRTEFIFFMAEQNSIMCTSQFLIHMSVSGHLYWVLNIINRIMIETGMHKPLLYFNFCSFDFIYRNGKAESYHFLTVKDTKLKNLLTVCISLPRYLFSWLFLFIDNIICPFYLFIIHCVLVIF